jgi:glycosyltransferase involved in cell wall biosynthesis/CelD/BcsL family acetyltransferase involved in cellulose biosynthesis
MSLTVLNVGYPMAPLGPDAVGGAEQILSAIEAAVVRAGHRSLVLACAGSRALGELVTVPCPQGPITEEQLAAMARLYRANLDRIVAEEAVDVVHCHGIGFHEYLPDAAVPVLATLHLPPAWYPTAALSPARPHTYLNCVSRSQRRAVPLSAALLEEVENGVDLAQLRPSEDRGEYALVLGRICPEKGMHLALAAARIAGLPLLLAGQVFPYAEHVQYFEREILPRLDPDRRFIGPVGQADKARLLAGARCLVVSSLVDETSSLVTMEALASGTPVIAFPKGALPDLVTDGETGFLVNDVQQMAQAMRAAGALQTSACRAAAIARFSQDTMCARYLSLYGRLADTHPNPRAPGHARPRATAVDVLDAAALARVAEAGEWAELWQRDPKATVFQRPEWIGPWITHLLGGQVCAAAVRSGGRLLALAPFFLWRDACGARVLSLMGAGTADYLDVLADGEARAQAAGALGAWLGECGLWDRCEWGELRPDSLLRQLPAVAGTVVTEQAQEVCPGLPLAGAGAGATVAAIPAGTWRKVAYARRHAARAAQLRIEEVTPATLDATFDQLEILHQRRWSERGGGALAEARVRAFHREAAGRLLAQDALMMPLLHLEGEVAAVLYGFHDRGACRYYLGGFDPALARFSPGSLLIAHAIEEAGRRGATTFDFLRGAEPYKYTWGATDSVRLVCRQLTRGSA